MWVLIISETLVDDICAMINIIDFESECTLLKIINDGEGECSFFFISNTFDDSLEVVDH